MSNVIRRRTLNDVLSISYNDVGKGSQRVIELRICGKEGELHCLRLDGTEDRTLCPCCMLPTTHTGIVYMIERSGIETLIWPGPYGHDVSKQIYILELIEEVKGESYSGYSKFRIRR